jgi:galactan endo-1,6-beta-galactosidase
MQIRGLTKTIISASDENSFSAALSSWNTITEEVEKTYVGRMNVHGYQGSSGPRYALQQAARNIGQGIWDSEYGDNDASGDTLLQNLMRDIQFLQPTAWVH